MSVSLTRRQVLIGGLGAAGVLAAAGRLRTEAAERADRSAAAPSSPVAIQRCESYEPKLVRQQLDAALKLIGGIGDLVRNKTVTVKLNLTGGSAPACGMSAIRTYHTHPGVVAALCAAMADEGAKQIFLVESFYFREPCEQALKAAGWDVDGIKSCGDQRVTFENTRNRGQWPAYSRLKVPWGGFVYPSLDVNQRYEKTDVFVSVAKLKDHGAAGVTAAVKNLFGITPQALYGDDAPNEDTLKARVGQFHLGKKCDVPGLPAEVGGPLPEGVEPWKFRVPRITADCLGARPVDLAIVEAVETVIGGEGPWLKIKPTSPKLLLAGRNAVCTDAVCAAVMGYDPQAADMQFPFPGENHLRLLASVGVGTNDLKRIEVRGLPVEKARHPFLSPADKAAAAWPYYGVHIA
jgi:uncharacterized protein (DUF362 family)